jgi:hypothetical protein
MKKQNKIKLKSRTKTQRFNKMSNKEVGFSDFQYKQALMN